LLRSIQLVSRLVVVVTLVVGIATLVPMSTVSVTIAMVLILRTGMAVVPVAKAVARPGVVVRT